MASITLLPAFDPGGVAVVTGGAGGIGLAIAARLAERGLKVVITDLPGEKLDAAAQKLAASGDVVAIPADVAVAADVARLRDRVVSEHGTVAVLVNNAAIGGNPGQPWENPEGWEQLLRINLMGVLNVAQAFVPAMLAGGKPGAVINTGSKQGITSPPGNPAYNLSKAGVRNYTESLAHALREEAGERISAHLLIPGFTQSGMTGEAEGAWTADQVALFMLESIARGDFYILCPDNDVDRATDEKRMRWAMDDIIENRPALSRWHPDYKDAFARYMAE
jgi:NAD(P)-dependent dehydrogenase (short-subunit alcohol dehydrogenase family)